MEDLKDLEQKQYNEIDMDCDIDMDEDDFGGFGSTNITSTSNSESIEAAGDDGRSLDTHTGIIINFGDSDDEIEFDPTELEVIDSKPLVVQDEQDILNAENGLLGQENFDRNDFTGINEIDMECEVGEDDDLDDSYFTSPKGGYIDFDEDEEYLNSKELVDEELINEKKKKASDMISQGKVEDDYYEKLKKKHASTNKKGAYNWSFHFAGNPKLEMDDFNHMMGSDGGNIPSVPNITTSLAGGGDDSPTFSSSMGGGECCAESLNEDMDYGKLFNDLLTITGFELTGDKGEYILKDKFSDICSDPCKSTDDIKIFLMPYIQDCFVIPLQVETGKDFKDCKQWTDWYNQEGCKEYPQCKQDVQYCDLYANHLNECNLF